MNPFCPNLSNPKIKQEFDELVDVFGEDVAYYLWNKNEGYSVDQAPDGSQSRLFAYHISRLNGNRKAAIKATGIDIIKGKSYDDSLLQYDVQRENPIDAIKSTINEIGLSNLINTLIKAGVDKDVAESIYNTVQKNRTMAYYKPSDVFNVLLQQRDSSLKTEYNKRILSPINKKLEEHLIKILKRYHFEIKDLSEFHTDDESINLEKITAAYDIFNKIIYAAKNRNGITIPEEFAHAFVRMMGIVGKQNETVQQMYDLLEKTSLYKQVFERYKNVYGEYSGYHNEWVPNKHKIREEALGQALAAVIVSKWNYNEDAKIDRTLFQKIKDWVFSIFDKLNDALINSIGMQESIEELPALSENTNDTDLISLLENLADQIIQDDLRALNQVDDTDYKRLDFSQTIKDQNEKDGGIALKFMQTIVRLGGNITGSLSYRLQGTIYRASKDSLHDIDATIPATVHNVFPSMHWHVQIHEKYKPLFNKLYDEIKGVSQENIPEDWYERRDKLAKQQREDMLAYLEGNDFIEALKKEYPDMKFIAFYPMKPWKDGMTLSAIWSLDNALSERFDNMRGSYAERLNNFTEEERNKIYLFDFFLTSDSYVPSVYDENTGLQLDEFGRSFDAKAHMGRPKDNYDYQRWEVYEKFKNQYGPRQKGLLFQQTTSSESYSDPSDLLDIYTNVDDYVDTKLTQYLQDNPNVSNADINIKRRQFINEYVQKRQREIMSDTAVSLANVFGLIKQEDGSWISNDDTDQYSKLRVEFVNSIDPDHNGLYEHNSASISAHHVIRIGLDKGDPTTFSHELAHHYIRMFKNSKVIQDALKAVDKPGMTDTEREEALVEKMVEISTDSLYGTIFDSDSFFHTFWNKFANFLYNVFDIKTNTVRTKLLQNATKAFMLNEQLSAVEDERIMFEIADEVKYSSASRGKFRSRKDKTKSEATYTASFTTRDEQLVESIVRHTEAKDKAYTRRGGVNERQIIKLQDAVYTVRRAATRIKEAQAANDVAREFKEKADLIIDYMERAAIEIASSVNMFNSAVANNYKEIVYRNNPDGTVTYDTTGQMQNPERRPITFDDLVNIKSDILSYHANLIGAIGKMLKDAEVVRNFSDADLTRIKDKYNTLRLNEQITTFASAFNVALDKACIRDIIQYVDKNVPLDDELKTRLKINMLKWLKDQNDFGDVSIYEQWIGLGSHSKSPVIRMMQDIINDLLYERDNPVTDRGNEIKTLLEKARKSTTKGLIDISKYNIKIGKFNLPTPWNIQKLFMEKDKRGLPTGNFATEINRGQHAHDKEDFISELLYGKDGVSGIEGRIKNFTVNGTKPYSTFELSLDKYNTPIFPQDPALIDIIKDYYRKMEKWRCENEDRQFTEKYYMERIDRLSPITLHALDQIQSSIGEIYTSCTVNGVTRTDLLTAMQLDDLRKLREKRAQLYNFYTEDGELKAQGSEEFQIAKELFEWSQFIKGKIAYKIDYDAFNKAKALAKNQQKFEQDNTEQVINPKVWEYYSRVVDSPYKHFPNDPDVQKLEKLLYMRNKMLSQVKSDARGFINMSMLWDSNTKTLKNKKYWESLQTLETSIYTLRNILKNRYSNLSNPNQNKKGFSQVFNSVFQPINENGPMFGNTVPRWWNEIYTNTVKYDPDSVKLLFLKGVNQPLGLFQVLIPTYQDKNIVENGQVVTKKVQTDDSGEEYEVYIRQPNSNFSIIDADNSNPEYVNRDFDRSDGKSYRPKKSVYYNKDFDKIKNNPELLTLYNKLIDTMQESWKLIPFLGDYDYRLPQMRGRTGQILGRRRNVFKSIGYQLSSWWAINETDEWFNNDYQTRPDGSRMDFIPVRFIKRLDRPEYISSDVCGSVISFFEMAKNYEIKSKVIPQFEAYLERFAANEASKNRSWSNVSQSSILQHITDVQMYGRQQEFVSNSKKKDSHSSNKIKFWLKRVKQSRGWAQASLLAFNFSSAIVSALDPLLSLTLDMITGRYTNYKDFFFATGVMAADLPRAMASLGAIKTYSKANAGMQFFQLSKDNNATYKDMDRSQFMRFMSDGLPMKIFTIGDYTINCITMISTMHNYKLYEYSNGRKKFLNKREFIKEAILDGHSNEEARRLYNKNLNLWEAFELNDGKFKIQDKYQDSIDDQTMKNVRKQVQSRSSVYNGIVPDSERTKLQVNVWTSFITMLRNFLIMGVNERFKTQRDFQVADFDKYQNINIEDRVLNSTAESIYKAKIDQSNLKGGWNFSTRQIEDGVFVGFWHVLQNMYRRSKYFLGYVARNQQENYEAKQKINSLSDFDKYAAKKVSLELSTIALLSILALFVNGVADEDPDDYYAQLLALVFTRLPSERMTFYSPTLVSDLITSPTSAMSAFRRFLLIFDLAFDLAGLGEHQVDDVVSTGTYSGYRRWVKDVCGILSGYGAHNIITNTNAKSLRWKNKFYKKILPVRIENLDGIMEIFGIDLLKDKSTGGSGYGGGMSSGFSSGLGGGFSGGI